MGHLSIEEIENIGTLMDGFEILDERNLINDCIIDLQDIKEMLMLKYHPMKAEVTPDLKKSIVCRKYPELMLKLKQQLNNVTNLIDYPDFQNEFGGLYNFGLDLIRETIKKLRDMIERKKFPILIAGEGNSGKSTVMNLLLGCDLMPTDTVTCTRMICEVRNSTEKRVTFIKDESDSKQDRVITFEDKNVEEIFNIVSRKDLTNLYTKGIFEYPVEFLDEFTILVDSPGVGDTKALEKVTFDCFNEYVPAFIFVLNATNSGGLNMASRKIILQARHELNREGGGFLTDDMGFKQTKYDDLRDKAIFIINQWDQLRIIDKSNECNDFRKSIIREIQTLWDKSATEGNQIFFISASQARQWMKMGIVQRDVIKLRQSLLKLVEKVYEKNFQNCLCLLTGILDYIEKIILQKINANIDNKYSRLYNKARTEKLCSILENLSNASDIRKYYILDSLKPLLESMVTSLTDHMKSEEVENRIFSKFKEAMKKNDKQSDFEQSLEDPIKESTETEVPKVIVEQVKRNEENLVDIKYCILKKILEKQMCEELKIWEEESKGFEKLYKFLNNFFEEQIREIGEKLNVDKMLISKSSLMSAWNYNQQTRIKMLDSGIISSMEKVFIFSAILLIFPIVMIAGLLVSPMLIHNLLVERNEIKEKKKCLGNGEDFYLKSLLNRTLQNFSEDDIRQKFFCNLSDKCIEHVDAFNVFIQSELNEKYQLIEDIEKENRALPVILYSLNNLLRRIEKYYGEYHVLKNKYLPDLSLIKRLMEAEPTPVIEETISMCQSSVLFRSRCNKEVVFKMYSKHFTQQFARFQMQEVNILSTGPFQYILHLRSMCYLEKEDKLLLILDDVECNLEQYLKNNIDLLPIYFNRGTPNWTRAFHFIIDVCKQLCTCLSILHNFDVRMVHPDLKIDTVLVSKGATSDKINILICDVCSNLPTQRRIKRSNNSQAEVLELCFDMGGYTKENIYRLGIILYKMAYFTFENSVRTKSLAFSNNLNEKESYYTSVDKLEHDINIDWSDTKHFNIPKEYNDLIQMCMSSNPEDMPDARQCFNILSDIKF